MSIERLMFWLMAALAVVMLQSAWIAVHENEPASALVALVGVFGMAMIVKGSAQ